MHVFSKLLIEFKSSSQVSYSTLTTSCSGHCSKGNQSLFKKKLVSLILGILMQLQCTWWDSKTSTWMGDGCTVADVSAKGKLCAALLLLGLSPEQFEKLFFF